MKNIREMEKMGEEKGFCRVLICDNATVGDSGILFFLNDEADVQDNGNCFQKNI